MSETDLAMPDTEEPVLIGPSLDDCKDQLRRAVHGLVLHQGASPLGVATAACTILGETLATIVLPSCETHLILSAIQLVGSAYQAELARRAALAALSNMPAVGNA